MHTDEKAATLSSVANHINQSFTLAELPYYAKADDQDVGIYDGKERLYNFIPCIEKEHIAIELDEKNYSLMVRLHFASGCSESFQLSISELSSQDILYEKLGFSCNLIISKKGAYVFREIVLALALGEKEISHEFSFTGFDLDHANYVISPDSRALMIHCLILNPRRFKIHLLLLYCITGMLSPLPRPSFRFVYSYFP